MDESGTRPLTQPEAQSQGEGWRQRAGLPSPCPTVVLRLPLSSAHVLTCPRCPSKHALVLPHLHSCSLWAAHLPSTPRSPCLQVPPCTRAPFTAHVLCRPHVTHSPVSVGLTAPTPPQGSSEWLRCCGSQLSVLGDGGEGADQPVGPRIGGKAQEPGPLGDPGAALTSRVTM